MPSKQSEYRRYLVPLNTASTEQLFTDCLIIGAGIAGLRAAIETAASGRSVTVVCKEKLNSSNTWQAQGGIASVLGRDDSIAEHVKDTLATGGGICNDQVVELVVAQGTELVRELEQWGTPFDETNGKIDITLEGGHSHARVAHALGDSTGRAIAETLIKQVKNQSNINVIENFYVIDLITNDKNECIGVIGYRADIGFEIIWSAATILAAGGAGMLYRETTNPDVATADGLAMAYRAGAVLCDMEFMQFHPTTLYVAGASRALVTETLRGEGATLVNSSGQRFMDKYHESGELAPRDIVSRAILKEMLKANSTHVYLDIRHFKKDFFSKRFPHISELCRSFDIDISRDLIPVRPSAHYMVGGVKTDIQAATNINGLYACGEVSSTGLHGANRLGSNSLLEGLVFGKIAGQSVCQRLAGRNDFFKHQRIKYDIRDSGRSRMDTADIRNSLRSLMWRNVGITRKDNLLGEAQEIIRFWQSYVMDKVFESPYDWECQNMLTISLLMAQSAQQRQESRGVHYRSDYPETNDKEFSCHIELVGD
jgi:L-aspartate oxidase